MQALVGDEETLDYRTTAAHNRMKVEMRELEKATAAGTRVEEAFSVVLSHYLDEQRGNLF